jgi:hypothetical protein
MEAERAQIASLEGVKISLLTVKSVIAQGTTLESFEQVGIFCDFRTIDLLLKRNQIQNPAQLLSFFFQLSAAALTVAQLLKLTEHKSRQKRVILTGFLLTPLQQHPTIDKILHTWL